MLSEFVREQIGVPEYHVDKYNNTSMLNYWCVVEPLLDIFKPSSICEIGSDEAITTMHIKKCLSGSDISFHVVDPAAIEVLDEYISEKFQVHRVTSVEFLERGIPTGFYFLDGDHNYETVSQELDLIRKTSDRTDEPTCVLMHDVGWPCARRDSYYSVGAVVSPLKHHFNTGLSLESEVLNEGRSFPCGRTFAWAELESGRKAGVLTAVEDFLDENENWMFFSFSSFYGCGVLYDSAKLSEEDVNALKNIERSLSFLNPLLAISEANRLRLIQGLHEHQYQNRELAKDNRDLQSRYNELYAIAEQRLEDLDDLRKRYDELFDNAEFRLHEINDLRGRFDELYSIAEDRILDINNLKKNNLELFEIAENRLSELSKLVARYDELYDVAEKRLDDTKELVITCDELKAEVKDLSYDLRNKSDFINKPFINLLYSFFMRFR